LIANWNESLFEKKEWEELWTAERIGEREKKEKLEPQIALIGADKRRRVRIR
jgi:hypothetical protein